MVRLQVVEVERRLWSRALDICHRRRSGLCLFICGELLFVWIEGASLKGDIALGMWRREMGILARMD